MTSNVRKFNETTTILRSVVHSFLQYSVTTNLMEHQSHCPEMFNLK